MKIREIALSRTAAFPIMGGAIAVCFWLVESVIDVVVFEAESTFVDSLLSPAPVQLWMRGVVMVLLVLFTIFVRHLVITQTNTTAELSEYRDRMERLVEERTNELKDKNNKLQEEIRERRRVQEDLEHLATTDPLTSLFNRRRFNELLMREIERDRRYRSGLSLMLCDLDHFKRINDEHGHNVGDDVLRVFADTVRRTIRKTDLLARWGGEEFALLVPEANAKTAKTLAEKVRKVVETTAFPEIVNLTTSIGVAICSADDDETSLIRRADEALYRAKQNGRNVVHVAG